MNLRDHKNIGRNYTRSVELIWLVSLVQRIVQIARNQYLNVPSALL